MAGKVDSFMPLVRLKHENEFIWGAEQKRAFERIKEYLASPPVLKAAKVGIDFRLYVAVQEHVLGVVLTQEEGGREFSVAYASRRLLDAEKMYVFLERLCLALYYACVKFRYYLLSSACVVVCQHDVVKYMLQRPILSGRMGKWAYSLVEYDLKFEHIRAVKDR